MKQIITSLALVLTTWAAHAMTNQLPVLVPRPAQVEVVIPQAQPALQPADPYAPPPIPAPPSPTRPSRLTNPPTVRELLSKSLRPASPVNALPPLPNPGATFTNTYRVATPSPHGTPITNLPPRHTQPGQLP